MKVLILFSSIRQCTVMIQRLVTNSTVSSERIRTRMYSMHHIYRKYVCVFTANLILLLNIKVSFAINISLLNVLHFIESECCGPYSFSDDLLIFTSVIIIVKQR